MVNGIVETFVELKFTQMCYALSNQALAVSQLTLNVCALLNPHLNPVRTIMVPCKADMPCTLLCTFFFVQLYFHPCCKVKVARFLT